MKLKTKLTAAILGVSAAAFALCGTVSALSFKNYSLDTAAAGEREKLAIAGRAFQQVGTREDFEDMGEIARDAYLKYQFRRCYEDGYALIKDGEPLVNLTGYEIVDLSPPTGEYAVQEVGGRRILLLLGPLPYPRRFSVLAGSGGASPCLAPTGSRGWRRRTCPPSGKTPDGRPPGQASCSWPPPWGSPSF